MEAIGDLDAIDGRLSKIDLPTSEITRIRHPAFRRGACLARLKAFGRPWALAPHPESQEAVATAALTLIHS